MMELPQTKYVGTAKDVKERFEGDGYTIESAKNL
jgi:hypothetical protein